MSSVAAVGDGFSVSADMCTGTSVRFYNTCSVSLCFSSPATAEHHVALSIDTAAGAATLDATAIVLPTSALDASFAGDGAVDAQQTQSIYFTDVDVTPLGGGLLTWVRWTYGYTYVTSSGVAQRPVFPMLNAHGFSARVVWLCSPRRT